jgi:hypothetical protein
MSRVMPAVMPRTRSRRSNGSAGNFALP